MHEPLRFEVVGSAGPPKSQGLQAVADGTLLITIGSLVAGGFLNELIKSLATRDSKGWWGFLLALLVGLLLVGIGLMQRHHTRRRTQVGVVPTIVDKSRNRVRAEVRQEPELHSSNNFALTLRVSAELTGDNERDYQILQEVVAETRRAASLATELNSDTSKIHLIPTMPLPLGFFFGAHMNHSDPREFTVHSIRRSDGSPTYFPATTLRERRSRRDTLIVEDLQSFDEGDPAIAALAVDLQAQGDQFTHPVRQTCHDLGVGHLLHLKRTESTLPENMDTFSDTVEQIVKTWKQTQLPSEARRGRHVIFINGPVSISIALGARLAATDHGRWTAFGYDRDSATYRPFPHWPPTHRRSGIQ
ncbi:SAVED domain-containing protein [Saccharopolyspora sp. TS4A08]|uniref:SAVED domain-containing protein n=1 Tax=Saccharopolyspora ipomoeae TaxID=3042027 RepID=A0ABT6PND2_9PSEU|nr:SAVED domain-containing protein [Saccharopolyspora sp. TS4A08]MDI2029509.1 SAVED domain-containing protein [Saccharopolyspora sp. TS4A08]